MCVSTRAYIFLSLSVSRNANTRIKLGCEAIGIGKGSVFLPVRKEKKREKREAATGAKTFRGIERGVERPLDGFSPPPPPSFPLARENRGCVFRRASPSRRGHSANFSIIPPPPPISSSAGTQDRIIFETSMILEIDNCFPGPPSTRLIRAEG